MKNYARHRTRTRSESARNRARRGWQLRHKRMEMMARATAEQYPSRLLGRLIAVNDLTGEVREFPFFSWDNDSDVRRKRRAAGQAVFSSRENICLT